MVLSFIQGVEFMSTTVRKIIPQNNVASKAEEEWISKELILLEQSGALEKCLIHQLTVVSPIRVVPKSNGTFRLVVNMRSLNKGIASYKSKLEGLDLLLKIVTKDCYFIKLDLKNGYLQVSVSENSRKFLGIWWQGQFYRYKVLPFGASFSPYVFNKITKTIAAYLRSIGIQCVVYLDDFVFIFYSYVDALRGGIFIQEFFKFVGLSINQEKSIFKPAQQVEFLGFVIDSTDLKIYIPTEKMKNLRENLASFLHSAKRSQWIIARKLAKIAGKVIAYMRAFAPARLLLRPLYRALTSISMSRVNLWNEKVWVDVDVLTRLQWVWCNIESWNGVSFWRPSLVVQFYSDASSTGFGFHCGQISFQGTWTEQEMENHINWKELQAVLYGIEYCKDTLQGQRIQGYVDSAVAQAYLNAMGGKISHLSCVAENIWNLLFQINCQVLEFVLLPSSENVVADYLSRGLDIHDWILSDKMWKIICSKWGTPTIDRFANANNTKLPRFNSLVLCEEAEGWDAFGQTWQSEFNYVCAPFGLLDRITEHIIQQQAKTIIIIPIWESQNWFIKLRQFIIDTITIDRTEFMKGNSNFVEPWKNTAWTFCAALVIPQTN